VINSDVLFQAEPTNSEKVWLEVTLEAGYYMLVCGINKPVVVENLFQLVVRGAKIQLSHVDKHSDWHVHSIHGQWHNSASGKDPLSYTTANDTKFYLKISNNIYTNSIFVNIFLVATSEEDSQSFGIGLHIWEFDVWRKYRKGPDVAPPNPIARSGYTKKQWVHLDLKLDPGQYILQPCTVIPGVSGSYTLQVLADVPCTLNQL